MSYRVIDAWVLLPSNLRPRKFFVTLHLSAAVGRELPEPQLGKEGGAPAVPANHCQSVGSMVEMQLSSQKKRNYGLSRKNSRLEYFRVGPVLGIHPASCRAVSSM